MAVAAVGEALALGHLMGLDDETLYRVLATTPLASETARRRPLLEAGDYPARFSLTLAAKDAGLIVDAAAGERLRLLEGVREWLVEAGAQGRGEQDYTAVLAAITGR